MSQETSGIEAPWLPCWINLFDGTPCQEGGQLLARGRGLGWASDDSNPDLTKGRDLASKLQRLPLGECGGHPVVRHACSPILQLPPGEAANCRPWRAPLGGSAIEMASFSVGAPSAGGPCHHSCDVITKTHKTSRDTTNSFATTKNYSPSCVNSLLAQYETKIVIVAINTMPTPDLSGLSLQTCTNPVSSVVQFQQRVKAPWRANTPTSRLRGCQQRL